MNRPLTLLALLLVLAASALGQVTRSGTGYLLRMKYKAGQVIKYTVSTTIIGATPQPTVIEMPMTVKCLDVKKGIAHLKMSTGPMAGGGAQSRSMQSREMWLDTQGRPVGPGGSSGPMGTLPAKPVKAGDKWKAEMPLEGLPGNAVASFIFRGVKTVGKKQVAIIGMAISSIAQGLTVDGKGEFQLLATDGIMNSMAMNAGIKMKAQNGGKGASFMTTTKMTRK